MISRTIKIVVFMMIIGLCVNGLAWGKSPNPRFMILINEKSLGTYSVAESENVITEYLLSQGLDVVDSELIKTNIDRDKALQAMMSGPQAAAALGLQFGAEVIIVGKAIVKGSAERIKDTSFRSYQAKVSLRAIRTDTAEILTYGSQSAAKIHVDDLVGGSMAIQEATNPLVARLIPAALRKWAPAAQGQIQRIQLVVGNVEQVWQVAAIKKLLQSNTTGIKEVIQRSFVSGMVVFDVRYAKDSQSLAEALTLAKPQYFKLKIVGVTPSKLDLRLVEKGS
jgi:hypothetical protein